MSDEELCGRLLKLRLACTAKGGFLKLISLKGSSGQLVGPPS